MINSFIHMNNLYTSTLAHVLGCCFFHSPPQPCSPTAEMDTGWPLNCQLCRQKSKSTQLSCNKRRTIIFPPGSSILQDGRALTAGLCWAARLSPPATSCRKKHAVRITFEYLTQVWLHCPYRHTTVNTSNFVLNPALSVPTPRCSTTLLCRV